MRAWLAFVLLASGCSSDPGACDIAAAGEIVYDSAGNPAFAGQAVIIQSCGGGAFCHSDTLAGVDPDDAEAVARAVGDRRGVPRDLNFDLRLASTTAEENIDAHARLLIDSERVVDMRGEIFAQIRSGRMPPGLEGASTGGFRIYDRVMSDGVTFFGLPRLARAPVEDDSVDPIDAAEIAEAREIVRNWLACRAPVVERTVAVRLSPDVRPAGFVVAGCERDCVDVRWTVDDPAAVGSPLAIYDDIIRPTCAFAECHDSADAAAGLDWESGGAMAVHSRILNGEAQGRQCRIGSPPPSIVVPGDPDASLFLSKLEATSSAMVCGSPMPLSGSHLSEQRLCVIRQWITCGACADAPDDEAAPGTCARCLHDARATCNVDLSQPNFCASSEPCANRFGLPAP